MTNEKLVQEVRGGRYELMSELYQHNKPFISSLIRHLGIEQTEDIEDAEQNAYFGLHEAVKGYDASKGYTFMTYAKYHIQTSIQRGYNSTLHIPEYTRTAARKIKRMRDKLTQELNRTPTTAELSEYTGIDAKTIKHILNTVKPVKSIYEPVSNDTEGLTVGDCIEDKRIDLENDVAAADERHCISAAVEKALKELDAAERKAIILFYIKGMTRNSISENMQLTAAATRKLIARGLKKLRNPKITRLLLEADIDRYTVFHSHMSVKTFKTTWTSSTEQTVISRDYRRKIVKNC